MLNKTFFIKGNQMTLQDFLNALNSAPEQITFNQTQQVIADNYTYTASAFSNNGLESSADTNQGSCKIFAFAQLNQLNKTQTLQCFGDFYRVDVLAHPDNTDHGNIRRFMQEDANLEGVVFSQAPLQAN